MEAPHKARWCLAVLRSGLRQNNLKILVCICHGLKQMTQARMIWAWTKLRLAKLMTIYEENKALWCSCIFGQLSTHGRNYQSNRTGKYNESDRIVIVPINNKADIIWVNEDCKVETLRYWRGQCHSLSDSMHLPHLK